jgi:hypothetical protein
MVHHVMARTAQHQVGISANTSGADHHECGIDLIGHMQQHFCWIAITQVGCPFQTVHALKRGAPQLGEQDLNFVTMIMRGDFVAIDHGHQAECMNRTYLGP